MGLMAEFITVFLYNIHTVKLGYKPLAAFFACQFRLQAPDMACGLVRSTLVRPLKETAYPYP